MRAALHFAAVVAVLGSFGEAGAAPLKYRATVELVFGSLGRLDAVGSGVAQVNASSGYGHLNEFCLDGCPVGSTTVAVTDPEVTIDGIVAIQLAITEGVARPLGSISGGGPLSPATAKLGGVARLCILDPNCLPGGPSVVLEFVQHATGSTSVGAGVGGLVTGGGFGTIRLSLLGNPWTLGQASAIDLKATGSPTTLVRQGFAHGPASLTSSTAEPGGAVQFVTPMQISTNLSGGANELIGVIATLQVRLIPEPPQLFGIATAVAALALLGVRRTRRARARDRGGAS